MRRMRPIHPARLIEVGANEGEQKRGSRWSYEAARSPLGLRIVKYAPYVSGLSISFHAGRSRTILEVSSRPSWPAVHSVRT